MWPDSNMQSPGCGGRASAGSEVVMVEDRVLATDQTPAVAQLNVTNSSRVHVGPKLVSVTQNIHNNEVIKGMLTFHYLIFRLASNKLS